MKKGLSRVAAVVATLLFAGAANATVYTIEGQDIPPGMVSGTITTDGALGVLTLADIVSTDLTVSDGVNTVVLNGKTEVLGSSLTATSTGLFFDYSLTGVNGFVVFDSLDTSAYCVSAGDEPCATVLNNALIEIALTQYEGPVMSGEVQIASASPAPEPAVWVMMVLGFAGAGLAGYRRAAKSAIG